MNRNGNASCLYQGSFLMWAGMRKIQKRKERKARLDDIPNNVRSLLHCRVDEMKRMKRRIDILEGGVCVCVCVCLKIGRKGSSHLTRVVVSSNKQPAEDGDFGWWHYCAKYIQNGNLQELVCTIKWGGSWGENGVWRAIKVRICSLLMMMRWSCRLWWALFCK